MLDSISLSPTAVPGLMGPVTREQQATEPFKAAAGTLGEESVFSSCPGQLVPGNDQPVLMSKLSPPKTPRWMVRRERLERLLSLGAHRPLTVVTGPPGAGKTLAMASWVTARSAPGRVAWMTLDGFDNNPGIFWRYLTEALRRAGLELPAALAAPITWPPEDQLYLRRLTSLLAAQNPAITLVLDDIHLLTEPVILDGLAYVLRNASSRMRLVVASRMDPLLPLHRYRLTGELAEIRAAHLAFTVPEAKQLLTQHGITLSAESLENLTRRTEGWAAGLRLAALSMTGHPDPERFVKEFGADDAAVTGYLMEEVLAAQPPRVREVLLKTSILDRVSDELACELVGNGKAAGVIPELAAANCFVRPIGHGWYRFHSLYAEVLRLRLRRETPHQVPQLRRQAARWLQRHGAVLEAARQAVAAGDWPLAARIAVSELAVGALIDPLAAEPLAALFREMPAESAAQEPAACIVAAALAVRDQQDEAATDWLHRAEGALDRSPDDAGIPSPLAATEIRFCLARRSGDLDAARAAAAQASALLARMPATLAQHPHARAKVLAQRGLVEMWAGDLAEAVGSLELAAACDNHDRAEYAAQRALAEAARGRLRQAAELASAATGPASGRSVAGPRSAAGEVVLAWASVERNHLSEAGARLARAEGVLRLRPDKLVSAVASLVAARQRLARGELRAAAETARRARSGWSPPGWLDRNLSLTESQAFAAAGDNTSAFAAASRIAPSEAPEAAVAQARVLMASGNPGAARQVLARTPRAANEAPGRIRLEARLVEAELAYRGEDPASGRRSLEQALRLAEREQLRLPITMQRAWIDPVVRCDPALAEAFRRLLHPAQPGRARPPVDTRTPSHAEPVVVEPLTTREREVLSQVAKMLSNVEIAAEMYISVNTVKTHLKSIFRKLGVGHRRQAVRWAQQLNLLLAHGPAPIMCAKTTTMTTLQPKSVISTAPAGDTSGLAGGAAGGKLRSADAGEVRRARGCAGRRPGPAVDHVRLGRARLAIILAGSAAGRRCGG